MLLRRPRIVFNWWGRASATRNDAYYLIKEWGSAKSEIIEEIGKRFRKAGPEELDEAYERAKELHDAAYYVGDRIRNDRLTHLRAVITLWFQCPGFTISTYRDAMYHGLFASR